MFSRIDNLDPDFLIEEVDKSNLNQLFDVFLQIGIRQTYITQRIDKDYDWIRWARRNIESIKVGVVNSLFDIFDDHMIGVIPREAYRSGSPRLSNSRLSIDKDEMAEFFEWLKDRKVLQRYVLERVGRNKAWIRSLLAPDGAMSISRDDFAVLMKIKRECESGILPDEAYCYSKAGII